jgi:hypothetical protein
LPVLQAYVEHVRTDGPAAKRRGWYGEQPQMNIRLQDLSPAQLAMIRPADKAALGIAVARHGASGGESTGRADKTPPAQRQKAKTGSGRQPRQPNKTEMRYLDRILGQDARYEALSFRLPTGERYTPDWVVFRDGLPVECHEVKGSFRFSSQGRSRMAWGQARLAYPGIRWVWATWTGKKWEVEG